MTGDKLLPCWHCGGEVAIALHSNEFGEHWWTVQRGHDDATACKCRLFMESDKFCLDVEEGEQAKDSPWAMELRARLVGKWNRRAAVTDHDFVMAVHDGELWGKCSECERVKEAEMQAAVQWGEAAYANDAVRQRDELLGDMWTLVLADGASEAFAERMRELGIEVDE